MQGMKLSASFLDGGALFGFVQLIIKFKYT